MSKSIYYSLITIVFLSFLTSNSFAQFTKLFDFNDANGEEPLGSLIYNGTSLYGMTEKGGVGLQRGVIFKILQDGNGFTNILSFGNVTPKTPEFPLASLYYDGTFLYGTTEEDDPDPPSLGTGYGIVFRIKPDGTQYTRLFEFNGTNGAFPKCSLVSDGTFLYGTTETGGTYNRGNIFKIKKDGTAFSNMFEFFYNFSNPNLNGSQPENSLLFNNTNLYGTTSFGGVFGKGVIYKIKIDGTGFTKLFDFSNIDGSNPCCSLIADSIYLYGTTAGGGTNNYGVIFRIKKDGTNYQTLLNFTDDNGKEPLGSLITDGEYLYGMTESGGIDEWGTIFKIKKDGSNFTKLYDLQVANGCCPSGDLLLLNGFLYGMTNRGGAFGNGTVFKIDTAFHANEPTTYSTSIYPTPFSSSITLEFNNANLKQVRITIINVLGLTVFSNSETISTKTKTIELNHLANGIYLLDLTINGERTIKKIVKD